MLARQPRYRWRDNVRLHYQRNRKWKKMLISSGSGCGPKKDFMNMVMNLAGSLRIEKLDD
jgi:hypothetical protein